VNQQEEPVQEETRDELRQGRGLTSQQEATVITEKLRQRSSPRGTNDDKFKALATWPWDPRCLHHHQGKGKKGWT
jgi:hypothetical protein